MDPVHRGGPGPRGGPWTWVHVLYSSTREVREIDEIKSFFYLVLSTLLQFVKTGNCEDYAERIDLQTAPLIAALKSESQFNGSLAGFPKVSI